ncbi:MAG: hypothetical protein GY867_12265 [bacterium]|nr:hypothetical protein [bacterium]
MKKYSKYLFCLLAVGILAISFMAGCTSKLDGEMVENQKPIVWFVNIPPEDARSSVNPIINWVGQDRDGQVDFFRYIVIRQDVVGTAIGAAADSTLTEQDMRDYVNAHLGGLPDSLWTILHVLDANQNEDGGPRTSNIIPMSAEIADPVLTFVPQIVFVQAFDEEGLGSDVAFRRFYRNDNPPNTRIVGFVNDVSFINADEPGGANTGIRIRWDASDVIDYPTDPPPFEFEWKLFGPYSDDDFDELQDSFLIPVFIANDARVFRFNQPEVCDTVIVGVDTTITCYPTALIVCDTTYVAGSEVIDCDTHLIDTISQSGIYGTLDTLFRVLDDDFQSSTDHFNVVADSSDDGFGGTWVTDTRDSLFNVYWNFPSDTSIEYNFFFWIRSRDDAKVPDLTPAWEPMKVIDPKHERDILVVNWALSDPSQLGWTDSLDASWNAYIQNWIATRSETIEYDPSLDYIPIGLYTSGTDQPKYLRFLLSHKIVINMQDVPSSFIWSQDNHGLMQHTYTALQTGVNMWVAARTAYGSHGFLQGPATDVCSNLYRYYFGMEGYKFDGWGGYAVDQNEAWRIEDFLGALSLDESRWPDVAIDSALLHRRYQWWGPYHWSKDSLDLQGRFAMPGNADQMPLGALPGVGWAVRSTDTEAMYLYHSLYGPEHFLGKDFSYNGRPVAHRLNRGMFRTVHWLFTPMPFDTTTMQVTVNNVLDWMWDGHNYEQLTQLSGAGKGSLIQTSAAEAKERYWNAYFNANGDKDEFYRLLNENLE